jgi:streptomycin 6-kinase
MLKVTDDADEKHGHLLMRWWAGLSPLGRSAHRSPLLARVLKLHQLAGDAAKGIIKGRPPASASV